MTVSITSPDGGGTSADFASKLGSVSASALSTSLKASLPTLASSLSASGLTVAVGQLTNPPTASPSHYSLPLPAVGASSTNMGVVGGVVGGFAIIAITIFRCYRDEPQAPAPRQEGDVWVERDPSSGAVSNNKI